DVSDPNNIGELDLSEISIKSELPTRVGEHKVIFTTVKGTEIEVMVTVYSKGTTKPNVDAIFANDFVIPFKDLSKEEMMALAGVVAYDETVNPGLQLPASAIEMTTSLPNTLGYYDITFILASGTSVTVTAEVTGVVIFEANDIEMTMEEFNAYKAAGTLQEEIIKRSGAKAIIEEIGRSATYLHGEGAYSGNSKEILYVVLNPGEIQEVKQILSILDPNAFTSIINVHEVIGDFTYPRSRYKVAKKGKK
ncbi:MAG: YitT family protein, partial [Kurthia sp.]